jgi:heptosyltransferase III
MKIQGSFPLREPRRILLLQLRRIGDTLLGTPALRALHARYPSAKIDFVVEQPAHEVLLAHPLVDRLLVAPRHGLVATLAFIRELRRARYDWAIDFLSNPRSAQLAFASGARIRVGLNRFGRRWAYTHRVVEDRADDDLYAVDLRLEILRQLGVPSAGRELEIFADQADPVECTRSRAVLAPLPRPRIAIAVGGGNPAKRYPADLLARVIGVLRSAGISCLLTSGPGESDYAHTVQRELSESLPHLADARVPTLACLYRGVDLYLGADSSPKHIAVACGLPTVTLFGPGNPANWNDFGNPRQLVLFPECSDRPHCVESVCAQRACLRRVSPESVVAAVHSLLPR